MKRARRAVGAGALLFGASCGAGTPPPADPIVVETPSAEPPPKPAEPEKPSAPTKATEAAKAPTGLAAGSPFYGAYEVQRIVKQDGSVEVSSGTSSCDVSDCVIQRRMYFFEGTTLRLRYQLVSISEHKGDASMTTVCDAQAQIDVTWEQDAMVVPTTVVAKANSDVIRRTQRPNGPNKYKVDWKSDHLGCSATLRGGRYAIAEVSKEKRGNRPAHLVLKSPEQQHELDAAEDEVDVQDAINGFFGQH